MREADWGLVLAVFGLLLVAWAVLEFVLSLREERHMTDEINDEGFEPVGPEHSDVANPVESYLLTTKEALKIGDLIQTKADGCYKVTEVDQTDHYRVQRVEEDEVGDQQLTFLDAYGIQVR